MTLKIFNTIHTYPDEIKIKFSLIAYSIKILFAFI